MARLLIAVTLLAFVAVALAEKKAEMNKLTSLLIKLERRIEKQLETKQVETKTDCKPAAFTILSGTKSKGGISQPDVDTIEACITRCVDDDACIGFDFTTDDDKLYACWLHTDSARFSQREEAPDVMQYILDDRCPPHCEPAAFSILNGTKSKGGISQPGVNTIEACITSCVDDDACIGFDFNTDDSYKYACWLHTDSAKFSQHEEAPGVMQYILDDRCPPRCEHAFTILNGTKSEGGISQPDVDTIEACITRCVDDDACIGFDFTTDDDKLYACWLHTDSVEFSHREEAPDVVQFILDIRCPPKTL